jgi:hypothetical protein
MNGIPWEVNQQPRQQPWKAEVDDASGDRPARKARTRRAQAGLGPIAEAPPAQRSDAATSTTDLGALDDDGGRPQKVQKGQINALAKMLSALRR